MMGTALVLRQEGRPDESGSWKIFFRERRPLRHLTSKSRCISSATRRSGKVLHGGSWKNPVARWRPFALLALISHSETANILLFQSLTFVEKNNI
jgi:hypothetical protein